MNILQPIESCIVRCSYLDENQMDTFFEIPNLFFNGTIQYLNIVYSPITRMVSERVFIRLNIDFVSTSTIARN